jgi:exodeoxyribonuclease VII large subunit
VSGGFFEFHERVTRRRPPATPQTGGAQAAPSSTANARTQPSSEPVTVSQLTTRIEGVLRRGIPETLYVRGEISNFKLHQQSGHLYFTLKDKATCIACVMWQSDAARLKFTPTDGMELVATAKLDVYRQRGQYQLYVTNLRPMGQGPLELAFQQLRAKLETQGLFAAERKKALPRYPTGIVLVTSREAAACHDMLKVLRRFSWLRIMIYPVPVQGDGAARRIAAALTHLNSRVDQIGAHVILLARGGGSLEDLWAFNEEVVARAVAASRLPVISGIGHEVDVCIADLVADHHAHTPTEAAQVAVQHWRTARDDVDGLVLRLRRAFRASLQDARHRLRAIERHEAFRRPLARIHSLQQFLDDRQRALNRAIDQRIDSSRQRVDALRQALDGRMGRRLRAASDEVARISALLGECHPRYRLQIRKNQVAALSDRLDRAMAAQLAQRSTKLEGLSRQLESLSPTNVLKRGFTLTQRKKDGQLLRSAQEAKPGDRLLTRFADGEVESVVQDSNQLPLFE